MLHKLILTSLLAFFGPDLQLPMGMAVATSYLITIFLVKPYIQREDDNLARVAQV